MPHRVDRSGNRILGRPPPAWERPSYSLRSSRKSEVFARDLLLLGLATFTGNSFSCVGYELAKHLSVRWQERPYLPLSLIAVRHRTSSGPVCVTHVGDSVAPGDSSVAQHFGIRSPEVIRAN